MSIAGLTRTHYVAASRPRARASLVTAAVAVVVMAAAGVAGSIGGCAFGYRAEGPIEGTHELGDVQTLQLRLPTTPLRVGGDFESSLRYRGTVGSWAGSQADASDAVTAAHLVFDVYESVGRLSFDVGVADAQTVALELEHVQLPRDRALEIDLDGGDISVTDVVGAVTVRNDRGDVLIQGAQAPIAVEVAGRGQIEVRSSGPSDVRVGDGGVWVCQQSAAASDVYVNTRGPVRVELGAATDLSVEVVHAGEIVVIHDALSSIAHGELRRTVGVGTTRVRIDSDGGDVEIRQADADTCANRPV